MQVAVMEFTLLIQFNYMTKDMMMVVLVSNFIRFRITTTNLTQNLVVESEQNFCKLNEDLMIQNIGFHNFVVDY
jgi:hypothetical protein